MKKENLIKGLENEIQRASKQRASYLRDQQDTVMAEFELNRIIALHSALKSIEFFGIQVAEDTIQLYFDSAIMERNSGSIRGYLQALKILLFSEMPLSKRDLNCLEDVNSFQGMPVAGRLLPS